MNPLRHPFYKPTVVLARGCVNLATLIWSAVVIWKPDALVDAGAAYAWVVDYVPEDLIAWALGCVAFSQMGWLLLCLPPIRFGSVGYGLLAFAWAFVWLSILLGVHIHPTGAACVPVVVGLAFYGFISNPRANNGRMVP